MYNSSPPSSSQLVYFFSLYLALLCFSFYESTTSAGPANVPNCANCVSFKPPENVVSTANATPLIPSGTGTLPPLADLLTCSNTGGATWFTNAIYKGAFGSTGTKNLLESQLKVKTVPACVGGWRFAGGIGATRVSFGSVMIGRGFGQETTNCWARLKAKSAGRGVSNGVGKGEAPRPIRRYASWRASLGRMEAASWRRLGLSTRRVEPPM